MLVQYSSSGAVLLYMAACTAAWVVSTAILYMVRTVMVPSVVPLRDPSVICKLYEVSANTGGLSFSSVIVMSTRADPRLISDVRVSLATI